MAISQVGAASFAWNAGFPGSGAPPTVLTDPGVAGAFLIAILIDNVGGPSETCTPPDASWTQLFSDFISTNGKQTFIFYKTSAVGSGTYTFTPSNANGMVGAICAYSGVQAINISNGAVDNTNQPDPLSIVAPSITVTKNNCMLVWCGFTDNDTNVGTDVWTAPINFIKRTSSFDTSFTNSTIMSLCICDSIQSNAGATGSITGSDTRGGTLGGGTAGYLIALEPTPDSTFTAIFFGSGTTS